ncbi:MAG: glycosyltransferase family 2 protein [Bacteroidota bacterium]
MTENSTGTPLISIGIPTMNRRKDLPTSINSVLAQDFKEYEILISDNVSTDDTQAYCEALVKEHGFVRYFRQEENIGMMANWNFLVQQAKGKYFMWLGDDDWIEKGTLSRYVKFLEKHEDFSLVSGGIRYWQGKQIVRQESGINVGMDNARKRVSNYYGRVKDGAMVHGLLRAEHARNITQKDTIGPDWHFVAAMAFQGKVRQLDFWTYNKVLGGNSSDFKKYARVMKLHPFWGYAPYIRIAVDAWKEIFSGFKVYQSLTGTSRFFLASHSSTAILFNFYIRRYPRIIAGKILRVLGIKTPTERKREKQEAAQTS